MQNILNLIKESGGIGGLISKFKRFDRNGNGVVSEMENLELLKIIEYRNEFIRKNNVFQRKFIFMSIGD
jgi:hypothetical protein